MLTDKPVGRVVYTHSHRDHNSGAAVFSGETVPVYASHLFQSDLIDVDETAIAANRALGRCTQAQFGIGLTSGEHVSLGCGPGGRWKGRARASTSPGAWSKPTAASTSMAFRQGCFWRRGVTTDHMVVWLPEQRILFCGDN